MQTKRVISKQFIRLFFICMITFSSPCIIEIISIFQAGQSLVTVARTKGTEADIRALTHCDAVEVRPYYDGVVMYTYAKSSSPGFLNKNTREILFLRFYATLWHERILADKNR